MASSVVDRLHENGRMAVETARCVAKFSSLSHLGPQMRERLREGVERRLWEIVQIMDQLALRERTPDRDRMLQIATQVEQLWDDIVKTLRANDPGKADIRKVA